MNYRDYSKFKLKSESEIASLFSRTGDRAAIVLSCNKCFKIYNNETGPEPEIDEFTEFAINHGKKIKTSMRLDFLCNEHRLSKTLSELPLSSASVVYVISCGIGMQTVSKLVYDISPKTPVFTLCNSIENSGIHGMALTDKQCMACGQCFLNKTNCICPISGCPKHLVNGQCGGAKDGMCETDNNRECVWCKIYCDVQKNVFNVLGNNVSELQYFDYGKVKYSDTNEKAGYIRHRRLESFYGGVYLRYCKDSTAFLTLKDFPIKPTVVSIPMSQHAGMSAEPIVSVGQRVLVGQKIGEAIGAVSSCVHSSVSGHVTEITSRVHQSIKREVLHIIIESDGKDELHKSVKPISYWEDLDILDIDAIIAEKGIVGMGGAGFPTPVKLKSPKPIDTILINGCESEPFITADHRIMLEKSDDIINGLQIIMKSTGAQRGIIVISDNKSDAITLLEEKTSIFDDIFVMALWSKYPQGAERMLIARALGRQLKYGQRPYDVGAVVINVSTARAIGDAFTRGMPLIERAVTVSGEGIKCPGNFMVRIGTPVSQILDYCGVNNYGPMTTILGGTMMGTPITDYNIPVIKGTNAIISRVEPILCSADCVRCGRCVDVCPMELLPLHFPVLENEISSQNNQDSDRDLLPEIDHRNCIECGACDYICPSGIKIRNAIRSVKQKFR